MNSLEEGEVEDSTTVATLPPPLPPPPAFNSLPPKPATNTNTAINSLSRPPLPPPSSSLSNWNRSHTHLPQKEATIYLSPDRNQRTHSRSRNRDSSSTNSIKSYELVEKSGEVFKGIYRGKIYAQQKKLEQGSSSICNVDSNPDHPGCLESEEDEDEGGGDGCKTATKNDDGNDPRKSRVKAGMVVALKIIIIQNELDGLPMTVLQEIRILKSLDHSNIVLVIDISYLKGNLKLLKRGNTYMVL
ncbi:hypothetical protein Pst134EB_017000 [Puccinia striiformis f. sp. tritici]|nr:hypothetical protein Pst134EB_017000 [Puccinia striiformis f. sp. tritici]